MDFNKLKDVLERISNIIQHELQGYPTTGSSPSLHYYTYSDGGDDCCWCVNWTLALNIEGKKRFKNREQLRKKVQEVNLLLIKTYPELGNLSLNIEVQELKE